MGWLDTEGLGDSEKVSEGHIRSLSALNSLKLAEIKLVFLHLFLGQVVCQSKAIDIFAHSFGK